VLPEVSQLLCYPCFPLLGRAMLLYHLPYPARDVESLKEVTVSHIFQLLPVKIPLREVDQPSDLGFGSIGNLAKEIIDFQQEIVLAMVGKLPSGNLHGIL